MFARFARRPCTARHATATAAAASAPQPYAWTCALSQAYGAKHIPLNAFCTASVVHSVQRRGFLSNLFNRQADAPPEYPEQPFNYKLGSIKIIDNYRWLADYGAARPYLQQEQRYYEAVSKHHKNTAWQILQSMRQHAAATQVADPPEPMGPYVYFTVDNPCGQDTIMRQNTSTGHQEVVLSADIMQQDAEKLTQRLGIPVSGDSLGGLKLSQDHQRLAYSLELTGRPEQYCCLAREIKPGASSRSCALLNVSSFEWSADGKCLYYCTKDKHGRPSKVFRRLLGQPPVDQLLFTEADPKHFVTLTRTKDWRYLLINTHSKLSSEVLLIDAHDSQADVICVHSRTPGMEYFVEHHHGHLLILTNYGPQQCKLKQVGQSLTSDAATSGSGSDISCTSAAGSTTAVACSRVAGSTAAGADATSVAAGSYDCNDASSSDYCLMSIPTAAAGTADARCWQLLWSPQQHTAIADMDVFNSCVVLHELQNARPGLRVLQLGQKQDSPSGPRETPRLHVLQQQQVCLPDWALALRPGSNQDYHSSSMRLYASSPAMPEVPLEVSLTTLQLQQLSPAAYLPSNMQLKTHQRKAPGYKHSMNERVFDKQQFPWTCKRLWAESNDGTQVPVTLLHAQDLQYTGKASLLVEVYGAYGQVLEADYRPHRLALLERGWAVALAHVRGGGEKGRRWHAAGRQLNKPNSVADLLACLQLLIQLRVTSPGRIAGAAASAGGLTLAAAVNAAPHLFCAVLLEAPFVDWSGDVGDTGLEHFLTQHEADEWGDPLQQPAVAEMIRAMCPYNNLQEGVQYPAMLVTAGLQDTRVPFWMPVKYVAKLRSLQGTGAQLVESRDKNQHQQSGLVLLQFAEDAGHFSMGHSAGSLEDIALQYAFLNANRPV